LEAFSVARELLPLIVGRDWSQVDDTPNYVSIFELPEEGARCRFVAVRGGRTLGHWTEEEAKVAGTRIQNEMCGRHCGVLKVGTWVAWANSACSLREPLTVLEFLTYALPASEVSRAVRQYKDDPLVADRIAEVQ
jgi:hypothetical protein